MAHEAGNNFTTIREIFHPIALLGGRQYAGYLCVCRVEGRLYLSEQNQWLWLPLNREKQHIPRIGRWRNSSVPLSSAGLCCSRRKTR